MEIKEMRKKVAKAYPSPRWEDRVYRMSDRQVYAVYHSLREQGKLNPKKARGNKNQQLTIFDVYGSDVYKKEETK